MKNSGTCWHNCLQDWDLSVGTLNSENLEQHEVSESERVRGQVIIQLEAIEVVLQEASDFDGVATIQRAIEELQSGVESSDRTLTAVTRPFENLLQSASSAATVVTTASGEVLSTVVAHADRVKQGIGRATAVVADTTREIGGIAQGAIAGVGVAGQALSGYATNLDWSTIDPTKYLYAGTRGISRGMEEAQLVWQSLPEQLRAIGPEELSKRLDGFDWSHKVPHSQGGGTEAKNGIFELASVNRARGDTHMTKHELIAAKEVLADQAFQAALVETASRVARGALIAATVACVVSCLEHGLEYQRGDIERDEMFRRIGRAVAVSAGTGATVSGVMSIVALSFPALIPLAAPIMIPLAVIGFSALGVKVVQLSKEWYELMRGAEEQEVKALIPVPMLESKG